MKFKTLLLGTAAALSVVGGAQAADLAVAEPVDYVKVCDAYGVGYWYIPGTDTCIRIGGYVKLDAYVFNDDRLLNFAGLAVSGSDSLNPDSINPAFPYFDDYTAGWRFSTETEVNVTAQSMTDYGPLTAFIAYRGLSENSIAKGTSRPSAGDLDLGGPLLFLDTAYLKIGPVGAGFMASTFDYGGGFTYDLLGDFRHDVHQDQVNFGWNLGGWGIWFSLEDPRDQSGGSAYYTGDFPDFVAAITGAGAGFDWKGSVGVSDTIYGTGYAGLLGATYTWGGGSAIRLQGAVSNAEGAAVRVELVHPEQQRRYVLERVGIGDLLLDAGLLDGGHGRLLGRRRRQRRPVGGLGRWLTGRSPRMRRPAPSSSGSDGQDRDDIWQVKMELKRSFGS